MPSNPASAHDANASALSESDSLPASDRRTSGSADWLGEEGQRSFRIRIGRSIVRIETSYPGVPDWLTGVATELNRVAHLPPSWARFAYRHEVVLTWASAVFVFGAVGAAITGSPEAGGMLGAAALVFFVVVDSAEPAVRSCSSWWMRLIYPNPRSTPNS